MTKECANHNWVLGVELYCQGYENHPGVHYTHVPQPNKKWSRVEWSSSRPHIFKIERDR